MMETWDIVEELARGRVVETLVGRVCRRPAAELEDLSQLVYIALLGKPAKRLQALRRRGELEAYIVGIIVRQYFSDESRYYREIVRFSRRTVELPANISEKV